MEKVGVTVKGSMVLFEFKKLEKTAAVAAAEEVYKPFQFTNCHSFLSIIDDNEYPPKTNIR